MLCLVAENTDQGNNEPSLSLLMTCLSLPKSTEVLFIISRAGTRPIKEHYNHVGRNIDTPIRFSQVNKVGNIIIDYCN